MLCGWIVSSRATGSATYGTALETYIALENRGHEDIAPKI